MPDFLTRADLVARITERRVIQYFDDDGDGVVLDADVNLVDVLDAAEGQYYSRLRRGWSFDDALKLAQNDTAARGWAAWIACELASERRVEFLAEDGSGAFMTQYKRAIAELDLLSKGRTRSKGENQAGKSKNLGGNTSTRNIQPPSQVFQFAPNNKDGTDGPSGNSGGF